MGELGLGGRRRREDGVGASVESLGDTLDVAALAGRVPPLVHENEGDPALEHDVLQAEQAILQALALGFVFLPGERQAVVDRVHLGVVLHDVEAGLLGGQIVGRGRLGLGAGQSHAG